MWDKIGSHFGIQFGSQGGPGGALERPGEPLGSPWGLKVDFWSPLGGPWRATGLQNIDFTLVF